MELLILLSSLLSVCVCQELSYPSTPLYTQFEYGYGGVENQVGSQNITLGGLRISEIPSSQQVIILPSSPVTNIGQSVMVPASTTKFDLKDFLNPFISTPPCPLSPHDPNALQHIHLHPPTPPHPYPHIHIHPHPHPHPPPPHLQCHPHPPPDPHHQHPLLNQFQQSHIEGIARIQTTDGNIYSQNPLQLVDNVAVPSSSPKFFSTEQVIPLR